MKIQWRFIAFLLLISCGKDDDSSPAPDESPTVGFNYSINGFVAPSQVKFTNQSSGATSCLWDFGDGTTSSEANPTHIFNQGGNFAVKLRAFNKDAFADASRNFVIQPPYSSCRTSGILLESIPFTDGSGSSWDPSDGPDLKFKILFRNTSQVLAQTGVLQNVTSAQLPLLFDLSPVFAFPSFNQEYDVLIYDDDDPQPDQLISGYYFKLSDAATVSYHYPDTMLLYQQGSSTRFKLLLEWGY